MSFFQLDTIKCKRDGICAAVCVAKIIENNEVQLPYIEDKKADRCIACGHCVAFCPHDACSVPTLQKEQFINVAQEMLPNAEQVDLLLKSRRSIRLFKKQEVAPDVLSKIFETVRYAPSAKNIQAARWVITKNAQETKKIADLIYHYFEEKAKVTPAPESIKLKSIVAAYQKGYDVFLRNAPQIAVCIMPKDHEWKSEDAAIALTYFEISAYAHGVGAFWGGYFTRAARNYAPLKEALGLQTNECVSGGQAFGYPIYKINKIPSRKPINITMI